MLRPGHSPRSWGCSCVATRRRAATHFYGLVRAQCTPHMLTGSILGILLCTFAHVSSVSKRRCEDPKF